MHKKQTKTIKKKCFVPSNNIMANCSTTVISVHLLNLIQLKQVASSCSGSCGGGINQEWANLIQPTVVLLGKIRTSK